MSEVFAVRSSIGNGRRRRGFTLLQILLVVGILGVLSAVLLSVFGRTRVPAKRVACDVHLKQIVLALDTFRQERGVLPQNLNALVENDYIPAETLRCPADSGYDQARATNASYSSYGDSYVIREPRDSQELPIVVCPFHEKDGPFGAQGYKGGYTKQFATRPATLAAGAYSGTVTVTRPLEGILSLPVKGDKPLVLRGGDRINTGAGEATIAFTDGSTANIEANSDMTVLQSFTEGQSGGVLYTLVRQFSGRVNYYVNPGSNFDVATPTATAGALGTKFTIDIVPAASLASGTTTLAGRATETVLTVTEHSVSLTTPERTIEVDDTEPAVAAHDPKNKNKERKPKKAKKAKEEKPKNR
jgi:type II secretory pathway pseudopilin PulG